MSEREGTPEDCGPMLRGEEPEPTAEDEQVAEAAEVIDWFKGSARAARRRAPVHRPRCTLRTRRTTLGDRLHFRVEAFRDGYRRSARGVEARCGDMGSPVPVSTSRPRNANPGASRISGGGMTVLRACVTCGVPSKGSYCPDHEPKPWATSRRRDAGPSADGRRAPSPPHPRPLHGLLPCLRPTGRNRGRSRRPAGRGRTRLREQPRTSPRGLSPRQGSGRGEEG
jgi:hypothetical protein